MALVLPFLRSLGPGVAAAPRSAAGVSASELGLSRPRSWALVPSAAPGIRVRALAAASLAAALAGGRRWRSGSSARSRRSARAAGGGFAMRKLGSSDLMVPNVCLGTMTWGQQNTEAEAHEQLDYAVKERGLKFMDTAEMYPVPTKAETQGRTDQYIGSWLKSSGVPREELVIASKVSGYAKHLSYLRDAGGTTRVNRGQIREAVEKSLQRLGTDYIDLLQIHWPDRHVSIFGAGPYDAGQQRPEDVSFEEQLRAFEELHKEGKVRHFGVSNETSLGVMSFAHAAEQHGLPKIVSIQNSYSLLVRTGFETDLAETCCKRYCNVGLLAYSPLAGGVLSGKYLHDDVEPGARLNLFKGYMERYRNSDSEAATREYAALAERHNMTPTQLALAWCKSRWFVTSSIIGATSLAQLKDNLDAFEMDLSEDALADIGRVYKRYRDPTINPVEKPAGQ